ncbi:MAG: hypothetical protein H6Q89_3535, partial [Myxococcaceae bacterium]|nr:hypothetical protein [Myxococcaceae bacterium]
MRDQLEARSNGHNHVAGRGEQKPAAKAKRKAGQAPARRVVLFHQGRGSQKALL